MTDATADVVVVGGGLAGCILALRLTRSRPGLDVRVVEAADSLCGNHTWSFFETDLTIQQVSWIDSLLAHRWSGYEVRFGDRRRQLTTGYRSMTSASLRAAVMAELGDHIALRARALAVEAGRVVLEGGSQLRAACVIDARGGRPSPHLAVGYQKFLGQEVELAAPHALSVPIVMDATVTQNDGYRFVYTLPLDDRRLLIEDTYYSNDGDLPDESLRARIAAYAVAQGWRIRDVVREERGVLPIVLSGDFDRLAVELANGAPRIGLSGALFHPTTGYSLPDAVRVADLLAALLDSAGALSSENVRAALHTYRKSIWHHRRYYRFLNRMLLQAAEPGKRHRILARFYGLDQALIERFYAGQVLDSDKIRIGLHMLLDPPIPVASALACVSEGRAFRAHAG
jgi:lycopene beta-cyclase